MRVTACAEMPLPFLFVTGSLGPVDTTARSSVELGTLVCYWVRLKPAPNIIEFESLFYLKDCRSDWLG